MIYYYFAESKEPLDREAINNGLAAHYSSWDYEGHDVHYYEDFVSQWNSIGTDVDDVYIFMHSNAEGFIMDPPEVVFNGFSQLGVSGIKGNVYLFCCHASGFAEKIANQTHTRVYATNSAVNYSYNVFTGKRYARRDYWDKFFNKNQWEVFDGR